MLPKKHVIYGLIFCIIIYLFFEINWLNIGLIFLGSVFIDVDHYLWYVAKKKDYSLKNAFDYLKKISAIHEKPAMMIFHTIEFLILIGLLGLIWVEFFYILIGMVFHSIFDVFYLAKRKRLYVREFFLIRYLASDKDKYL